MDNDRKIELIVPSSQVERLIWFYQQERVRIKSEFEKLACQLAEIETVIENLAQQSQNDVEDGEYKSNWTWAAKAEYCLRKIGVGATVNELVSFIAKNYEPKYQDASARKEAVSKLAASLKMKYDKHSVFGRYRDDVGNWRWVLLAMEADDKNLLIHNTQ